MVWLGNIVAVASGLILISAGFMVGYMRYRYRSEFRQSHGHIKIPASFRDEASDPGLVELNWKEAFECGHPVIDAQHRRLFGLCNGVIDMVVRSLPDIEIQQELAEIIDHVEDHFSTEEAVLERTKYPLSAEHKAHHLALLDSVKALRAQYAKQAVDGKEVVRFIAYDVIAGHILKEDLEWAAVARA